MQYVADVPSASEISSHVSSVTVIWREVLPVHPAAEIIPAYSDAELKDLGEQIKAARGLKLPIIVLTGPAGPQLLDGRSRIDALCSAGIRFRIEVIDGHVSIIAPGYDIPPSIEIPDKKDFDAVAYVLAANVHRRHLTNDKKRAIVAKVIAARPGLTDHAIAKVTSVNAKTVKSVREKLSYLEIPIRKERVEPTGRRARGRKPTSKAPVTKPVGSSSIDQATQAAKKDMMVKAAADYNGRVTVCPPGPARGQRSIPKNHAVPDSSTPVPNNKPITTTTTKSVVPVKPVNKFEPAAPPDLLAQVLNHATRARDILNGGVSGPNTDAAREEVKRIIDLLKPSAAARKRALGGISRWLSNLKLVRKRSGAWAEPASS
jgi:ParB-like chromosome segregation protein Spo0J